LACFRIAELIPMMARRVSRARVIRQSRRDGPGGERQAQAVGVDDDAPSKARPDRLRWCGVAPRKRGRSEPNQSLGASSVTPIFEKKKAKDGNCCSCKLGEYDRGDRRQQTRARESADAAL